MENGQKLLKKPPVAVKKQHPLYQTTASQIGAKVLASGSGPSKFGRKGDFTMAFCPTTPGQAPTFPKNTSLNTSISHSRIHSAFDEFSTPSSNLKATIKFRKETK
eukprot:TRINITY_DN776119_c0_g1_i1.p1 TRINITY_DN776119_c0_g1~~TRINITY_DN776119_c0_g1_i1.p1  ORF type:complete len:105 (-),score=17.28 TRINITY_DN776119_c0_g1_i1:156-470(-)